MYVRVCVLQQLCDKRQQPISVPGSPCLPEGWNSSSDVYTLQYRHEKTGGTCLVKAIPVEGELLLNALVWQMSYMIINYCVVANRFPRTQSLSTLCHYQQLSTCARSQEVSLTHQGESKQLSLMLKTCNWRRCGYNLCHVSRVFQNILQLMGLLNKNIVHQLETVLSR